MPAGARIWALDAGMGFDFVVGFTNAASRGLGWLRSSWRGRLLFSLHPGSSMFLPAKGLRVAARYNKFCQR